ncbi:aldehyde-activating protein [Caulobacter sp. Root655]|uniref:GFA family protein n=1 Tax=Caulobacter sp. Root655 TaxID=1736578 RepID=UPI0006F9BBE6|nr:GFA family protein [Caulobacter sp. Root655]KRA65835.1 aldehyde-activating protein [Caulobacter sp. Root655]
MTEPLTGGCQCGAVRFRISNRENGGEIGRASICHCRMCQKAFAGPFGALVTVSAADLVWTRGAPAHFQSSDQVRRGFCAACGTPLTFDYSPDGVDLAVFAFDDPSKVQPVVQLAVEGRPAWMEHLADMPVRPPLGPSGPVASRQHPDHDT